jgi:hypothetical protein
MFISGQLRRMTRSEMHRNPPKSPEAVCPRSTNCPKTTRIGTPAGSAACPENSPDQPRPGGKRRGRAGLKRSARLRGLTVAPALERSSTSRQDEVRNGSSPNHVPPGKCGRMMKRVTRVRFRKDRATRQTPFSTTRRRVAMGIGSARVPQFSCQFRFAAWGRATVPEPFDPQPPTKSARPTARKKRMLRRGGIESV